MRAYPCELADGREWLIPVARLAAGQTGLPHRYGLSEDGTWHRITDDAYDPAWQLAERIAPRVYADMGLLDDEDELPEPMSESSRIDAACHILGLLYTIGPVEIDILRVLDPSSVATILAAFVDAPAAVEAAKKNGGLPDMSSMSGGETVG
jgi:hypothetical protein